MLIPALLQLLSVSCLTAFRHWRSIVSLSRWPVRTRPRERVFVGRTGGDASSLLFLIGLAHHSLSSYHYYYYAFPPPLPPPLTTTPYSLFFSPFFFFFLTLLLDSALLKFVPHFYFLSIKPKKSTFPFLLSTTNFLSFLFPFSLPFDQCPLHVNPSVCRKEDPAR